MFYEPFQRPVVQSTIFDLGTSNDAGVIFSGARKGYAYSRFGNPSVEGLAEMIADLEGGSEALITSSGNAAVLCAVTAGLEWILHAVSLGGMESLATRPTMSSHRGMTSEARLQAGVSDSLIRLSVGAEALEDLFADLDQAITG